MGSLTLLALEKDWHVQPMAAPDQQVVSANYKHASFRLRRACSVPFLMALHGTWQRFSPASFERSCY